MIGRNVNAKCDIILTMGNFLRFPNSVEIPIKYDDFHSYIPFRFFRTSHSCCQASFQAKIFCATGIVEDSEKLRSWTDLKKIIGKVHKHVCGHASLSDMKTLLERNGLWSSEVEKYLCRVAESCEKCARTY